MSVVDRPLKGLSEAMALFCCSGLPQPAKHSAEQLLHYFLRRTSPLNLSAALSTSLSTSLSSTVQELDLLLQSIQ